MQNKLSNDIFSRIQITVCCTMCFGRKLILAKRKKKRVLIFLENCTNCISRPPFNSRDYLYSPSESDELESNLGYENGDLQSLPRDDDDEEDLPNEDSMASSHRVSSSSTTPTTTTTTQVAFEPEKNS